MGRTVIKIAGLLLGLLLFVAGITEAIAFGEFAAGVVREFPMPREISTSCALAIVAAEILSGAGLYFRRTRRLSGAVAAILFVLFSILVAGKILGGSDFQCDGFGILALRLPPAHHLLLDLSLAVVSLMVAWHTSARPQYSWPRRSSTER